MLATPRDQLANANAPKKKAGLTAEQIAKMEQEMESLERDMKAVSETYTENMFNLTCGRSYIKKLLENVRISRFLNPNYPDILATFEDFAATESL